LILSSPVWIQQLWVFIVPGLTRTEKRYTLGFVAVSIPLFLAGACLAFFAMPNAVRALTSFTPEGASNIIPAQEYLSFVMIIIVVFGLAFVLPVLMVGLNMLGILSANRIRKSWRIVVLIVFVFAAIATPAPGAISMFFLASPLLALFFLAWVVCVLGDPRRKTRPRSDPMSDDLLNDFQESLGFRLDRFQRTACQDLLEDRSVLVAAPTGAGKTVVAQFAVALARHRGVRVFYTAPIKALSNQK